MKKFNEIYEEMITEKKSWKITKDGNPIGMIVDTGKQTKYAFDGFAGDEREVQTYKHTKRKGLDDMTIVVFDNGRKKTLSYGSQTMGAQPSKMSDMDVLKLFMQTNHGPDAEIKIS